MRIVSNTASLFVKMFVVVTLLLSVLATSTASAVSSQPKEEITIHGRGWGHGRGMSQYGALGYAEKGWSAEKILDHFYGGTTLAPISDSAVINPNYLRVNLRFMEDIPTTVSLASGKMTLLGDKGTNLGTYSAQALKFVPVSDGYQLQVAPSCVGPWRAEKSFSATHVTINPVSSGSNEDALLKVCGSTQRTWYAGSLVATKSSSGSSRTVNIVSLEDYLRGVVPNESPSYWPAQALRAQAVAARSYVAAGDTRFSPYADTCDTARCQVYDGRYTTRGGSFRASTMRETDAAIQSTENMVRIFSSGKVARTEFSSSTGGHTAGGDFPAVADEGDAVESNPNHTWTVTIDTDILEKKYDKGAFLDLVVLERNGLGADGGRVLEAEYHFEDGKVAISGDRVRLDLGLKSDWFTPGNEPAVSTKSPTEPKDEVTLPHDTYIEQSFTVFTGKKPTENELSEARTAVEKEGREKLALKLMQDEYFSEVLVNDLYRTALGREAEGKGRTYWLEELANGLPIEDMGLYFYGSEEYWEKSGGKSRLFVEALYQDVLGRTPDAQGLNYWVSVLEDGEASIGDVTYSFYVSDESRTQRASRIYYHVVGSRATAKEAVQFADRLRVVNDFKLAAELAAQS